jgi:hypothetical protein
MATENKLPHLNKKNSKLILFFFSLLRWPGWLCGVVKSAVGVMSAENDF